MAGFMAPNIPVEAPVPTPEAYDAGMYSLRELMNARTVVQTVPIYQKTGSLILPDIPYQYGTSQGWYSPALLTAVPFPMSAPDVPFTTGSYSSQIQKAATAQPQTAQTGVRVALRAPAINEGYL